MIDLISRKEAIEAIEAIGDIDELPNKSVIEIVIKLLLTLPSIRREEKKMECGNCRYCQQFKNTTYGKCAHRSFTWVDIEQNPCGYFEWKEE